MTTRLDRSLGVTSPGGFVAAGVTCGLKPSGGRDLALVAGSEGTVAAGCFTTNVVVAAPVTWSRRRLATSADARVVVLNSGNANACTGPGGDAVVEATAKRAALELGCRTDQVLVCSTGVIGVPLDASQVTEGIAKAVVGLSRDGGADAADAIRTTDTVSKQAGVVTGGVTVAGMAKGAAMLAPSLRLATAGAPRHATMLVVLTTDAAADPADLRAALDDAVQQTFNRITVDGSQSTNDSVLLLASGASGRPLPPAALSKAVTLVCDDLAAQLVADAEGATKSVAVHVRGAGTERAALQVARRVADSPLVKTAMYGGDPNWGRILQAAGDAGVDFDPTAVGLDLAAGVDRLALVRNGTAVRFDPAAAAGALAGREVGVFLDLGGDGPWAAVRTSDLTPEYVRLNAEYTT